MLPVVAAKYRIPIVQQLFGFRVLVLLVLADHSPRIVGSDQPCFYRCCLDNIPRLLFRFYTCLMPILFRHLFWLRFLIGCDFLMEDPSKLCNLAFAFQKLLWSGLMGPPAATWCQLLLDRRQRTSKIFIAGIFETVPTTVPTCRCTNSINHQFLNSLYEFHHSGWWTQALICLIFTDPPVDLLIDRPWRFGKVVANSQQVSPHPADPLIFSPL